MDISEAVKSRDNFHKKRNELKEKISQHQVKINEQIGSIRQLQTEINNSRPFINGCDDNLVCKKCDIYSMEYMGDTPEPDRVLIYECVICGYREESV